MNYQQPIINGMFNFILPSEEDYALAPEENLGPNSAGLESSRTGTSLWRSRLLLRLRENHCLVISCGQQGRPKERFQNLIFSVFWNLRESQIGALYKVSPSKFVLVFGSKAAKEKLQGTEIQCRFGDSEICLNFRKRTGPLRNGRKPIFVTILLPEFISDQAVRLALSPTLERQCLYSKVDTNLIDPSETGKDVRIFPVGGDPAILPRKISFHVNIQRDVLFAEKVVLCYRCKTRHMFGKNCPVLTPT